MSTIAEALLLRSDLQRRVKHLRTRIEASARTQEGETPQEDPTALLGELEQVLRQFETVSTQINAANQRVELAEGGTMSAALGRRDRLRAWAAALNAAANAAAATPDLYSSREVRWIPQVPIAELRRRHDAVAEEIRVLNVAIQAANWLHTI